MPHLNAYHRPNSINQALQLISRQGVNSAVIAGGTYLVSRFSEMVDEVVDLQAIGLTNIDYTGTGVTIEAMVTLQSIVDDSRAPALLREAAHREGPNTLRNQSTIGGLITRPNKESELLATLLVLDAHVKIQTIGETKRLSLSDFMQDIPAALGGGLVVSISVATMGQTASDRVARTPADRPIVAAVARKDNDGKIWLALCGVANTPVLVDPHSVKAAVNPVSDFRGSTEYRRQMASTLSRRVLSQLS